MVDAKRNARDRLAVLLREFGELSNGAGLQGLPEATARTWIERFLAIFGWNPADPRQVMQEYTIGGREARRLEQEGTRHRRPDYALASPDGRSRTSPTTTPPVATCRSTATRLSIASRSPRGWAT